MFWGVEDEGTEPEEEKEKKQAVEKQDHTCTRRHFRELTFFFFSK